MKEQVVTPRAGRGGGRSRSGALVQRPAKRERGVAAQARGGRSGLRKVLGYLPLITKIGLAVVAGLLLFAGYRAAASASFFDVRAVDVAGTSRVSADEVKSLVRRSAQGSGVWHADLDALSREIERLPWVRRAIVSRVLPDGLRVRITEREQRAVVRTGEGRLVWVDEDAVLLGTVQANDRMPPFFIRGWDESGTNQARVENRARVEKYMEMLGEWQKLGLVERVSEVNLIDLKDVRVQLAGDDAQIEILVGRELFGERLRAALKKLDMERGGARGTYITRIDASRWMKSGDNVLLGIDPNAPGFIRNNEGSGDSEIVKAKTDDAGATARKPTETRKKPEENTRSDRRDEQKRKSDKKEAEKKERASDDSKGQSRPRRVG